LRVHENGAREAGPFRDLPGTRIVAHRPCLGTSAFHVRVFRTEAGYLAWVDGLGTVEGRTLTETRLAALRFVQGVVGGAFPDRPAVDPAGAQEVLEFEVEVRARRPRSASDRPTVPGPRVPTP
jgi:hypothetical protein